MALRLIINADDFGWDAPATAAILALAAQGALSSTTAMANLATEADLAALRGVTDRLSVGYHLNLISGHPVAPAAAVPSLLGPDGQFRTAPQLWLRYLRGRVRPAELAVELAAQIGRLRDHGLPLSHADSHQHLHLYPRLGPALIQMLGQLGIGRVRRWSSQPGYGQRGRILNVFGRISASGLRGLVTPNALAADFSAAQAATLPLFAQGLARARRLGPIVEFMTHPGLADRPGSYLARCAEYEFWRGGTWRAHLAEQGGRLIRYDEI
ncbi:carbohydrate deacetylase [Hymenobacter terricola]|uniref:carbohydrate deacetylase n=1 Tax=Hymenobacter terricola TaxID=2819236 RepID=UPI001B30BC6B|nr:ChbG/HpnK family deacetylase [Hymenobacter terricola]